MITEWLVSVGTSIAAWFGTLFGNITIPTWATDAANGVASFLTSASGLGAWLPLEVLGVVSATMVTVYLVTFTIKLLRAVASYIPFFGGAG